MSQEEQEEQDKQVQYPWLSHLDQERRNLSASIEETLESAQGQDWDEEDENADDSTSTTAQRQALIPPRLSLQSKTMPAVRKPVEAASDQAIAQQPAEEVHHASAWTRITHRLASVFGLETRSDALPDLPPPSHDEAQRLSRQRENSLLPLSPLGEPEEQSSSAAENALHGSPTHRLGGRTSKVRLQTAAIPAVPGKERDAQKEQTAHRTTPAEILTTPDHKDTGQVPLLDASLHRETVTEEHPPVKNLSVRANVELHTAFGGGAFEEGQTDVFVKEPLVTERSVVMVTLTSNPGRVVVQYTSLSSHSGFTVHLTAPVAQKTTFNYVVLEGGS